MEHNHQIELTETNYQLPEICKTNFEWEYAEKLPFHKYLSRKNCISSSGLKDLITKSPYYFKKTWIKNLDATDEEDAEKDHFRIGHAVHLFFLEPKEFKKRWILQPKFSQKKVDKIAKKLWKESLDPDAIVITQKEMEMILNMAESIKQNRVLYNIFAKAIPESSIFGQDAVTGLLTKVRPDIFIVEQGGMIDVFDVKTTRSIYNEAFTWDAGRLKYHMQLAFYADHIQEYFKKEIRSVSLIPISKEFPCEAQLRPLNDLELEKGKDFCRAALNTLKQCIELNAWPQYREEASMLDMPQKYILEQIPQWDFSNVKKIEEIT